MFSENAAAQDDIAIRVRSLDKVYQIYASPKDRLKQAVMSRLRRMFGRQPHNYFREFTALQDTNLVIRKGETVGVIGKNGSGKSTLLQIICGTLYPSSGTVEINGRIAALLELGSGFNTELTGRENVYMNATILGLTESEIDAKYDDIVAFADLGAFIDQPVKTYSSGMIVRLAFAVQAQTSPDILVVDEALAVGDVKFQAKCFERIRQLKETGTTILLVTHATEQVVTHCSRAILLSGGRLVEDGEPRHIVNRYLDILFGRERIESDNSSRTAVVQNSVGAEFSDMISLVSFSEDLFSTKVGYNANEYRWGDGSAVISDFCLKSADGLYPVSIRSGDRVTLGFAILFKSAVSQPIVGITIKTKEGVTVYGTNSEAHELDSLYTAGASGSSIYVEASFDCRLAPGDYFVSVGVATKHETDTIPCDRRYDSIHLQVEPTKSFFGLVDLEMNLKASQKL